MNNNIKKKKKKRNNSFDELYKNDDLFICECGSKYKWRTNKYRHLNSRKHIGYLEKIEIQDKLKPELDMENLVFT